MEWERGTSKRMVCQREVMGLLEYQAMPSLRVIAHDDVLSTFKWCGPSGQATWTVHCVQNHTLLGHSPTAAVLGQPSSFWPLKGQCHEMFCFWLFFMNQFPPSPRVFH
jgi:hypothetical protein